MEIGKPVKEVPAAAGGQGKGKFAAIWDAARKASPDWVPVDLPDLRTAHNVQACAYRSPFEVRVRGNTVYVRYLNGHEK